MKCDVCGKETPKEFHWKSAFDELEERVYCSTECVEKENAVIKTRNHNTHMKERWLEIKFALFNAIEILEEYGHIDDFSYDYPNIIEKTLNFQELLLKDYE